MIPRRVQAAAALIAAAAVFAVPTPAAQAPPPNRSAAVLKSLAGFDDLQAAFRKDGGQVRLVLLLSPT